jgi:4'-phosphopantetheinyl transferase
VIRVVQDRPCAGGVWLLLVIAWQVLTGGLTLSAGTIDVVLAPLVARPDDEGLLDAEELRRADRLRRAADRRLFVATHATRRRVLAATLGCAPATVVLAAEPGGKPYLPENAEIIFNDSGCRDAVLVVATRAAPGEVLVGADIEPTDTELEVQQLLSVVAAPSEERALRETPSALAAERFLRLFTAKEALLKAVGVGLTIDVREVVLAVDGDFVPVGLPQQLGSPSSWWVVACEPPTAHVATVAVRGLTAAPELRRWILPTGARARGE